MTMRIFSVIFVIMMLISATTAYGQASDLLKIIFMPPIGDLPKPSQEPTKGFWFKPDVDRERLKQDYSECREKGERRCMRAKGYGWLSPDTLFFGRGFWYKNGTDIEDLKQDYNECRGKGEELCMMVKDYIWVNCGRRM
jgi:hypothetical protein